MEPARPESARRPGASGQTFIGVDVGGTKVSIGTMHVAAPAGSGAASRGAAQAAVPERGGPAQERVFSEPVIVSTERSSQEALLGQLGDGIEAAVEAAGGRVAAVGLGIPSVIDFAKGLARASVNVPLHDAPVRDVLKQRLGGLPVYLDNDATCAALAEAHDERGRLDTPNLVMLTLGTGVGGGIVIEGRPYRGATGAAGELGHTIIGLDLRAGADASPAFPREGSLEALASGRALDGLARGVAAEYPDSALGRLPKAVTDIAGTDLVEAVRAGDSEATAALSLLGERLGVGVANAINTFDPEVVAIGGGVSLAGRPLLEAAKRTSLRFVLPGVGTATEVRLARSGPQAGVRGAALLASIELGRASRVALL
jgi:glucokinase